MAEEDAPHSRDPIPDIGWRYLKEPAIYCDTFSVDVWEKPGIVRLTFGEYTSKDFAPFFRTAVAMPLADARALMQSLQRLLKDAEKTQEGTNPEK